MKDKRMNNHVSTGRMAKKRAAACIIVFLAALSFVNANDFSEEIIGNGRLTEKGMVDFLLARNRSLERNDVEEFIKMYISEAKYEGVNHDIAFAQMCYHTKYLTFAGTFVKPFSFNFGGLAHTPNTAYKFTDREEGIKAHIQHLKGYAVNAPLNGNMADPRYNMLKELNKLGTAPTLSGLSNKWGGSDYALKVRDVLGMAYRSENISQPRQNNSNSNLWY
jgi:hypothetical protein